VHAACFGAYPATYSRGTGVIFSGIEGPHLELTADIHLVTKFRGHGDLLTFFQISSWHGVEAQDLLNLTYQLMHFYI